MSGQIVHGKFEVLEQIGRGGMGVVYRARQISLDRIVALKMLSAQMVEDLQVRERFRQEAKIIARLTHPNIVQVYDIYDMDEHEGSFCIVMEYLDGRSLRAVLRELKQLPAERAAAIVEQIAAGLTHAHSMGIIHRDIKPDNIIVLGDDRVKITDFGIAHLRGSTIHTETGLAMGTPHFMSPEQAAGKAVDHRTDLYSLSVVLYMMVTGEVPFTGDGPVAIALKHIHELPRRPSEFNPAVPPMFDSIILKGMAKQPEDRYQNAEEFRETLTDFRSGAKSRRPGEGDETWLPPPAPTPQKGLAPTPRLPLKPDAAVGKPIVQRPAARRRGWLWLATTAPGLLALVIVVFAVVLPWQRDLAIQRQLARSPFEQALNFLRDLDRTRSIEEMQGLIQKYEGLLRDKALKAIGEQTKPGLLLSRTRRDVERNAERVIYPYLTDQQREQWTAHLRGLDSESARPSDEFDRLKRYTVESLFNEPVQRANPDAQRARQAFQRALSDAKDFKRTGKSQLRLPLLIYRCVRMFQESIAYDPNNWQYHLEFARFLSQRASESDTQPRSRETFRQEAIKMAERASDLSPDAERAKIKKFVEQLRTAPLLREETSPSPPDRGKALGPERDRTETSR